MKRALVLLTAVLFALVFAVYAGADSEDIPGGAVWRIESADGAVSYSNDYFDGLSSAENGDRLTLIPDYLELDSVFTLDTGKSITVDIGNSRIVYPNNTHETPLFNIRSTTSLTIYADGAELYLQDNVRSFISIANDATLVIWGGENGFYATAPDVVDAGNNATVELHNVHFMKNSGNMMGLVCARASSTVKIYDSTLVSSEKGNAIYSCVNGRVEIYNTNVVSLDNSKVIQVTDDNSGSVASLYVEDSVIYGNINNTGSITAGGVSYFSSSEGIAVNNGYSLVKSDLDAKLYAKCFVAPSSYKEQPISGNITAYTLPVYQNPTSDRVTDDTVWMVKNEAAVYYTDDFYYPIKNSKSGDELTLLSDVKLSYITEGSLKAKSINLGNKSIRLDLNDSIEFGDGWLFKAEGEGELTLTAGSDIMLDVSLLYSKRPVTFNLNGVVSAKSLAYATGAAITVNGGKIYTKGCPIKTVGDADITLCGVTVIAPSAVSSGNGLSATEAVLVNTNGGDAITALGDVSLLQSTYVAGGISAARLFADKSVYFDTPPTVSADFILKPLASPVTNTAYPDALFSYRTTTLDGEIRVSLTLSGDMSLNVFVPTFVYNYDAFTLISVDGIVYTPTDYTKTALIGTEEYAVFSYSQLHASDVNEDGVVRVSVSGYEHECHFTLAELLLRAMNKCEGTEVKRVVATYLDYAFDVIGFTPVEEAFSAINTCLAKYEIPIPTAPEIIRSVYFDAEREIIQIIPADGVTLKSVRLDWNGKTISVGAEDGVINMPFLRFDPSLEFTVFYQQDGGTTSVKLGILSLYSTVSDSTGHSTALFRKYLSYLMAYKALL